MELTINGDEIILLKDFELSWRWERTHNELISEEEKKLLFPLSKIESKRIFNAMNHIKNKIENKADYSESDWMMASSDSEEQIMNFRKKLKESINGFNEDVIAIWDRHTSISTSKEIFLKYWDDFCYPSSDDTTIISTQLNWLVEFRHYGVANIWTRHEI